ncbi:MAG: M20 metallopeptidase family protein [Oscillospiraceae bacterium]
MADIKALAHEVFPYVVEMRRDFHRNPEPSFEEFRTTDRIAEELDKMGIPYRRFEPSGLVGDIVGGKPGKCIFLRADIDALSVKEESGVEFASEREGFMHACGHDTHAAMLLGAAKVLNSIRDELCGSVKVLFQPAEELAMGAKHIIAQGAIEGADAGFGMHIFAQQPVGQLGITSGVIHPAADYYKLDVHGVTSHGALPDEGVDATVAAAAIVMNLQTISSREFSPLEPVVVTVGTLHSGQRFNVISNHAELEGTVRLFNEELHQKIPGMMARIAENTAAAFRCTAELDYQFKSDMLVNDEAMTELARGAALKVAGEEHIAPIRRSMGGEDFSAYTHIVPCAFVALGGGGEAPQHSEKFCIDESAFETGVAMYAQVAVDFLNG